MIWYLKEYFSKLLLKPLPEKEKYLTQKRCFISVNWIIWFEFLCLQPIKLSKGPLALGFLKIRMSLRRDLVAYRLLRIWDYRFVVQCKHILIHCTVTSFSVLLESTSFQGWMTNIWNGLQHFTVWPSIYCWFVCVHV